MTSRKPPARAEPPPAKATTGSSGSVGEGEDEALWRRVTADVRPLSRRSKPKTPPVPPPVAPPDSPAGTAPVGTGVPPRPARAKPAAGSPPSAVRTPPPPPELAPGSAPGVDARIVQRLKRGRMPPEARIDLHLMTQEAAHRALTEFLAASQAAHRRSVLVITGKGFRDGSVGVLKANVPRWLNEAPTRGLVLAFTHAAQADGGEGALYVLLRRRRAAKPG